MKEPVLQGPNWEIHFHIHYDASNKEIGAILGQEKDKVSYVIYYTRG